MFGNLLNYLRLGRITVFIKAQFFQPFDIFDQYILIFDGSRQNIRTCQIADYPRFYLNFLGIIFQQNFMARLQFFFCINSMTFKNFFRLFSNESIESQWSCFYIWKSSLLCFLFPSMTVSITFKKNFFTVNNIFLNRLHECNFFLLTIFNQGIYV